jgi:hypothetical protein
MRFRIIVPTSAIVIACVGIATGTAQGTPNPGPVSYVSSVTNSGSVVTTLSGGSFELTADGKRVAIEDAAGNSLLELPLAVTDFNGLTYPVAQQIVDNDTKLVLTPIVADRALAPLRHNAATIEENQAAIQAFFAQLNSPEGGIGGLVGAVLGGLLFGIVGGLAGCGIGLLFAVAGCVIGGPLGLIAGGIAGVLAGAALGGGAVAAESINQMFETFIAAPWTTKFYNNPNNGLRQNTPIPVG